MPILFGVRHLSPAGAWHLIRLLEEKQPDLVLVEGPSDLTELMEPICVKETVPPIAMMAYSETVPIHTILYPLADYSPEYQAILWAYRHGKQCRFMDLPSSAFLAFAQKREERLAEMSPGQVEQQGPDVYAQLDALSSDGDHETMWERLFEHNTGPGAYHAGVAEYGRQLRAAEGTRRGDYAENLVREAYMKRVIEQARAEGFADDRIVVVTGAYHVEGLSSCAPMTDEELKSLPHLPCKSTLMPYSYYRLSSRSGYGAGNKAPAYYELLWEGLRARDPMDAAYRYLTLLAGYQREHGNLGSSAQVIEAVRLASQLARMTGGSDVPTLRDLQDAALTCLANGNPGEIALARADTEIGTRIGRLPPGVSRTSLQEDFRRLLKDLRLEKYATPVVQPLDLDLRENTRVKTEKAAFIDLERSFFLHRMAALGVRFAVKQQVRQDKATWAESWNLRWTPETEIEIVEAALKGDTVELAAAFAFRERLDAAAGIADTAAILSDACCCGMPLTIGACTRVLQELAVDAAALPELALTAHSLSTAIRYGSIRRLDPAPLLPILEQLFFRACLVLPSACVCNNAAAAEIISAIGQLDEIAVNHDNVDQERWLTVLTEISNRDDLNAKASGFATAILLERGQLDEDLLSSEVARRLDQGVPADLGASWFEGLSMKNKYALITRLSLWRQLSGYIDALDGTEFKRALVFLRRAFSEFSPTERCQIAENLGEVWGVDSRQVSETLFAEMGEDEQELLDGLSDFDFDSL